MKDTAQQIKLINQALAAATASIELSRQLLAELTGTPVPSVTPLGKSPMSIRQTPAATVNAASVPGVMGFFDGENMVTADGTKYPVPVNYASKTLLVCGDKLKMIDAVAEQPGESGGKIFKQIERVKRQRVNGVLSQKEGVWYLTTSDASYKVLEASVKHFGVKEGDRLIGILPKDNKAVPFAALEGLEATLISQVAEGATQKPTVSKISEVPAEVMTVEVAPIKEAAPHKASPRVEVTPKEEKAEKKPASTRSPRMPEVVAEVPESLKTPVKAEKKEEASPKLEKTEKKNEPVISDDDLR